MELGADDELADFPYIFASGRGGYATHDPAKPADSMQPLLDMVLEHVPGPEIDADAPLQMLVTTLDWSDYVGRIAIGRIQSGTLRRGRHGGADAGRRPDRCTAKVTTVYLFDKLGRTEVEEATAGDIAAVVGLPDVEIGDTISDAENPPRLAAAGSRRADAADGVLRQHVAAGRPQRQVPHHAGTCATG